MKFIFIVSAFFLGSFASAQLVSDSTKSYKPTAKQKTEIADWYKKYDELIKKADVEAMADHAAFPLTVISDDPSGKGISRHWNREEFVKAMTNAMSNTPKDIKYNTVRTPLMINDNLAMVLTEWDMTANKKKTKAKYADILVKDNGTWKFKTMVQAGWGEFLKQENESKPQE